MLVTVFILAFSALACGQGMKKVELAEEKTPYDYVNERLDAIGMDARSGLPLSNSYEVEESEDYPEAIKGAASNVLNTVAGVGGIGLGQGLGFGGLGLGTGIGQGIGIGLGGVGGLGVGGFGAGGIGLNNGGIGVIGGQGIGAGGVGLPNGIGYINPGLAGLGGFGGIGIGNGYLYHPIVGAAGGGYLDKKAYDAAQKKDADENIEKVEKKVEEEAKHGQEGFQQAAEAAKSEKGESGFYKGEEAKKKAAGDEKFYEGGQKIDKQGKNFYLLRNLNFTNHKSGNHIYHIHLFFNVTTRC